MASWLKHQMMTYTRLVFGKPRIQIVVDQGQVLFNVKVTVRGRDETIAFLLRTTEAVEMAEHLIAECNRVGYGDQIESD